MEIYIYIYIYIHTISSYIPFHIPLFVFLMNIIQDDMIDHYSYILTISHVHCQLHLLTKENHPEKTAD